MPAPVCDGSQAGGMGWGGVELAGFNTNQMGGWIDGQMDEQITLPGLSPPVDRRLGPS